LTHSRPAFSSRTLGIPKAHNTISVILQLHPRCRAVIHPPASQTDHTSVSACAVFGFLASVRVHVLEADIPHSLKSRPERGDERVVLPLRRKRGSIWRPRHGFLLPCLAVASADSGAATFQICIVCRVATTPKAPVVDLLQTPDEAEEEEAAYVDAAEDFNVSARWLWEGVCVGGIAGCRVEDVALIRHVIIVGRINYGRRPGCLLLGQVSWLMGDDGRGARRRRHDDLARIATGIEVEVEVGVRHIVSAAFKEG